MSTFENKVTKVQGVHYSRYIAAWNRTLLKVLRRDHPESYLSYYGKAFKTWLKDNCCTEEEINDICNMAECGKMEIEIGCVSYIDEWFHPKKYES